MLALSLNVQELLSGFLSKERERLGKKVLSAEFEKDLSAEMSLFFGQPPAAQNGEPFIGAEQIESSVLKEIFRASGSQPASSSDENSTEENIRVGNPLLLQQILAQLHAPAEIRKELADEMGDEGTIGIQSLLDLLERSAGSNGTVSEASVRDLLENIRWKEGEGSMPPAVPTTVGSSDFDLNRLETILADVAAQGDPKASPGETANPTAIAFRSPDSTVPMTDPPKDTVVGSAQEHPTFSSGPESWISNPDEESGPARVFQPADGPKRPEGPVSQGASNRPVNQTNMDPKSFVPQDADVVDLQVEMVDDNPYSAPRRANLDAGGMAHPERGGASQAGNPNGAGGLTQGFDQDLAGSGSNSSRSPWQNPAARAPEAQPFSIATANVSQAGAPASAQDPAGQPARLHLNQALWPQELTDHLARMNRQGRHRMTLELEPKHLGKLTLRVETHGAQVSAWVQAEHPDAREILLRNTSFLQQLLSEQGLSLGNFSVDVRHERGAAGDGEENNSGERGGRNARPSKIMVESGKDSGPSAYDRSTGRTINLKA